MNTVYPNQAETDRGTNTNVSDGRVGIRSKNKKLALKLLEILSQERSQKLYSPINFEYPENPRVNPTEELASCGIFKEHQMSVKTIAKFSSQAKRMIDRVEW